MEYCYAVCLGNGIIKFGRTCDLHARIYSHVTAAAAVGVSCICALVSGSTDSLADDRKMMAIAKATLLPHEHGNEYFKGTPEDALQVMARSGLLPVPTYPDKESSSGGVRFVVARLGADLSGYKLVRIKSTEPKSVLSVLKSEPMSEGVIKNKCRKMEAWEVEAELDVLVSSGQATVFERQHTVNKLMTKFYALA